MSGTDATAEVKRKEIYTYNAPWPVYGLGWCLKPNTFRFAVGSFIEEYRNKVQVRVCGAPCPSFATLTRVLTGQIVELDDEKGDFVLKGTFDHPYPTTNILWAPAGNTLGKDLLATTGDYLRLWNVGDDSEIRLECLLNNVRNGDGAQLGNLQFQHGFG